MDFVASNKMACICHRFADIKEELRRRQKEIVCQGTPNPETTPSILEIKVVLDKV